MPILFSRSKKWKAQLPPRMAEHACSQVRMRNPRRRGSRSGYHLYQGFAIHSSIQLFWHQGHVAGGWDSGRRLGRFVA